MDKANPQGRISEDVANLFSGLLGNARDGSSYYITGRSTDRGWWRILINRSAVQRKAKAVTFAYDIIESYLRLFLKANPPNDQIRKQLDLLDSATEDNQRLVRRSIRQTLKQTMAPIYLLVVPHGRWRLCAVQLWQDEENRRTYLIGHRRRYHSAPWAFPIIPTADLRQREVAAQMEEAMKEMDVEKFMGGECPFSQRLRMENQMRLYELAALVTKVG